mmetsp:Transcript_3363/g.9397  ORF Transcript_3363/g.9397 Transcript_3363/m.9397 type:complete len:244 (-) Transcript_3363:1815-2546(-)
MKKCWRALCTLQAHTTRCFRCRCQTCTGLRGATCLTLSAWRACRESTSPTRFSNESPITLTTTTTPTAPSCHWCKHASPSMVAHHGSASRRRWSMHTRTATAAAPPRTSKAARCTSAHAPRGNQSPRRCRASTHASLHRGSSWRLESSHLTALAWRMTQRATARGCQATVVSPGGTSLSARTSTSMPTGAVPLSWQRTPGSTDPLLPRSYSAPTLAAAGRPYRSLLRCTSATLASSPTGSGRA